MSDIADILASGLHDVDVVPSDVAVGLILLREEQDREDRQNRAKGEVSEKKRGTELYSSFLCLESISVTFPSFLRDYSFCFGDVFIFLSSVGLCVRLPNL